MAQGRANIDQWHKPLINEEIVKSHFYDFVSGNAREGVSGYSTSEEKSPQMKANKRKSLLFIRFDREPFGAASCIT